MSLFGHRHEPCLRSRCIAGLDNTNSIWTHGMLAVLVAKYLPVQKVCIGCIRTRVPGGNIRCGLTTPSQPFHLPVVLFCAPCISCRPYADWRTYSASHLVVCLLHILMTLTCSIMDVPVAAVMSGHVCGYKKMRLQSTLNKPESAIVRTLG